MNQKSPENDIPKEWTSSRSVYPRMGTVARLFEEQVHLLPDNIAVSDGVRTLSYGALNRTANRLAQRLLDADSRPGDRIAIAGRRSVDMVTGMLAVLKSGGVYVPVDASGPAERINFVLEDAQVRLVLIDEDCSSAPFGGGRALVPLRDGSQDEPGCDGVPLRIQEPEDAAYVMYTSGSTGAPKGVEVTHRGIIRLVRNTNYVDFGPSDVVGQIANPAFDAITFEVWGALLNGGRLAIVPTDTVLSPTKFAAAIRGEGITTMFLTASLFSIIAATEPTAFATMKTLVVGGDAVDPNAARKVLGSAPPGRLVNGYGPTECTTFSVCHLIERVPENAKSIPIGRPISNSEAYILDADLQPVAPGVAGDLYLGGDGLAKGYLNRPELTQERFIPHPFDASPGARLYKTGDRARFLEDGLIDFLGRQDHQVKFHGFRIELPEIEIALRKHAGVVDAVVKVWKRSENDERLVGYVSALASEAVAGGTLPSKAVNEPQLRQFLQRELPSYMVPSHIVVLASLPINAVGKIDRSALPDPSLRNAARQPAALANPMEREIAQIWQEVLRIEGVGPEDNFFDVGGTSLTLALVESRLRSRTEAPFSTTDLFRYSSIRTLAQYLNGPPETASAASTGRLRGGQQRAAFKPLR
jgi:amino acid adenylation domain-containing protein